MLYRPTLLVLKQTRQFSASTASARPYNIVFCGSDEFSCTIFKELWSAREELIRSMLVVTPPDTRTGRHLKTIYRAPLRKLAKELSVKRIALKCRELESWRPSEDMRGEGALFLTASFGCMIPSRILELYEAGHTLNVHPSLLPQYRGAAPIQWAIANGETESGVTVQELSMGKFDRGRILAQHPLPLGDAAYYATTEASYAKAGGELLVDVLRNLDERKAHAKPQDGSAATKAPKITKEHARIRWAEQTATDIVRLQRAIGHQHTLWTSIPALGVLNAQLVLAKADDKDLSSTIEQPSPGQLAPTRHSVIVGCAQGTAVRIESIKIPGRRGINATDWINGLRGAHESPLVFE